ERSHRRNATIAAMTPRFLAAAATLLLAATPAAAQFPIFDAHIHYSKPDWSAYTPERALSILAQAGVRRAIVSSTPDDGTLLLYDRAPAGIVPFLRPYRTREDMGSWTRDPAVAAYVEERLNRRNVYRGIGESHFGAEDVEAPTVRRIAELAKARGLFLQCHIDETTVEKMLTAYPGVKILWAHAGMSSAAATVARLVDRYPMLWVELALRTDVAADGTLDPERRAPLPSAVINRETEGARSRGVTASPRRPERWWYGGHFGAPIQTDGHLGASMGWRRLEERHGFAGTLRRLGGLGAILGPPSKRAGISGPLWAWRALRGAARLRRDAPKAGGFGGHFGAPIQTGGHLGAPMGWRGLEERHGS